ncbi:MAG: hypothetical protein WC242_03255 [Candidatus Paceibacterota bacterium]|jgi:hypothetical protein
MKKRGMKCLGCSKAITTKTRWTIFNYDGFRFRIDRGTDICPKCAKAEAIRTFEKVRKGFVWLRNGEVVVNWRAFVDNRERGVGRNMIETLENLNILSLYAKGRWSLVGIGPVEINPRSSLLPHYFTRLSDARAYGRAKFGRSGRIEIRHIDRVTSIGV